MKKAILAKKIGMTQIFTDNGNLIPVTVLESKPCVVVQKKTLDNDGYEAVQIGFGDVKIKHVTNPLKGHFEKSKIEPRKILKEFKLDNYNELNVGDLIKVDTFSIGDKVDVSGRSKGKGYQGAIKRHNQHRGPMSHGSKYHRGLGSMGSGTTPGKVRKNKAMAGHMGHENITTQNLQVVRIDLEKNLILLKGCVPGPNGSVVLIKDSLKK